MYIQRFRISHQGAPEKIKSMIRIALPVRCGTVLLVVPYFEIEEHGVHFPYGNSESSRGCPKYLTDLVRYSYTQPNQIPYRGMASLKSNFPIHQFKQPSTRSVHGSRFQQPYFIPLKVIIITQVGVRNTRRHCCRIHPIKTMSGRLSLQS